MAACVYDAVGGARSFSTAIYFLVPRGSVSRLHRIRSAEVWHFYLGSPLTVYELDAGTGEEKHTTLGSNLAAGQRLQVRRGRAPRLTRQRSRGGFSCPQHVVPAGAWFGSFLAGDDEASAGLAAAPPPGDSLEYALVGCTVAPGFDFADFEMASRAALLRAYPHAAADITRLTDPQ